LSPNVPNAGGMAQISRPFQIGLAALAVFVLAWFAVLHRPGSSPSEPAPASSTPAAAAPKPAASTPTAGTPGAGAPGASTPVYHGAAPGVEGLTRDIAKAHGAVTTSEKNAQQLQSKSAQASNEATTSVPAASTPATATRTPAATASAPAASTSAPSASTSTATARRSAPVKPAASAGTTAAAQQAAQQAVLQKELKQGKVLLLLFWNPKSSDDRSVRQAVQAVSNQQRGRVAAHVALANQVSLYGSVTRNVGVLQTPTLLVVAKQGLAVTMSGLVDQYAIEQAIIEAKKASA
jgi:hypothetical protein